MGNGKCRMSKRTDVCAGTAGAELRGRIGGAGGGWGEPMGGVLVGRQSTVGVDVDGGDGVGLCRVVSTVVGGVVM